LAQATRKALDAMPVGMQIARGLREGALIVLLAVAAFLLVALVSYHPEDPSWSNSGLSSITVNRAGVAGAWVADILLYLFGYMAYLFPVMVVYAGLLVYQDKLGPGGLDYPHLALRGTGFLLTLGAGCALGWAHFTAPTLVPMHAGGILGDLVGKGLFAVAGELGATVLLLALFLTGITLFSGLSWVALMDNTGAKVLVLAAFATHRWHLLRDYYRGWQAKREREAVVEEEARRPRRQKPPRIEPVMRQVETSVRVEEERQVPLFEPAADASLPSLSLLDEARPPVGGYSDAALEAMSRQLEIKLKDFGIEVEVVAVNPGPVITRFEIKPAPGVKVSQISNLAKDLARSLSAISVRIVEVIPGKSVIGLELPNEQREMVWLSEILKSREYDETGSPLALALGKDISGHPVVVDLARMPHLLVAGTTGSGKSVALNAMILSMLYKATINDVRLIMIDPKMLELSVYEGIPHLLTPVVTDVNDAQNALRWCVAEMERRYALMAALGVRNISGYNRKVREGISKKQPVRDPMYKPIGEEDHPTLQPLPFVVVVVDELADMMMLVGKQVEQLIARLAQKARAAGIHLILATQRPSVDVITGLIKANIPSRIAFQVSSKIDSRTILDQMGAETLLGHGDMLYLAPGTGLPSRVHGAFVDDHEVHRVVDDLKRRGNPEYIEEILKGSRDGEGGSIPGIDPLNTEDSDPLYDEAVQFVTRTRRASISSVQRRLKIGYNRAARMIEEMERTGVVSPAQHNGTREVIAPEPVED